MGAGLAAGVLMIATFLPLSENVILHPIGDPQRRLVRFVNHSRILYHFCCD
jgi:hypothetical protein